MSNENTQQLPATISDEVPGEIELFSPVSVFDIKRYEQVDRVAGVMAAASLIPDHLKGQDYEQTKGNCFMICNLAANWELDPFAVAQASALVFGKIVLEGKLVRAVIKRHLGFDLHYAFFDEGKDSERVYVSENPLIDDDGNPLSENDIREKMEAKWRITPGAFEKWHTKSKNGGVNDNWLKDRRKMMRERGAREWCREFAPGLMLGVYTRDEMEDVDLNARANRAKDITADPVAPNPMVSDTRQPSKAETETKSEPETNTKSKPSESAPREDSGDAGGEDGNPPPYRLSAEEFRAYHAALARMEKRETIKKADTAHWKSSRGPVHADDIQLIKDIGKNHGLRGDGQITLEMIKDNLEGWIKDTMGDDYTAPGETESK